MIGTGNFGSIDGDPPADPVFTRCRLSSLGAAATTGIVPHLLINGAAGTVGGATSAACRIAWTTCSPPRARCALRVARCALIEQPELADDEIVARIPGPDVPTGGVLPSQAAARQIYLTGEGRLPVRGRAELATASGRPAVVVTELPFSVALSAFTAELTDGVHAGRLPALADVVVETGPRGFRIVLPLRSGAAPGAALDALFARTRLEIELPVDMVALVDGTPRRVSLPALLRAYVRTLADRGLRPPTARPTPRPCSSTGGLAPRPPRCPPHERPRPLTWLLTAASSDDNARKPERSQQRPANTALPVPAAVLLVQHDAAVLIAELLGGRPEPRGPRQGASILI